jgi:hypothetical protein
MSITKKIIPVGLTLSMAFSQASFGAGCDKALTKDFQKAFHDAREIAVPTETETNNYFSHLYLSLQIERAKALPEKGKVLNKERIDAVQKRFSEAEKALNKKYSIAESSHVRLFNPDEFGGRACVFDRIDFPFSQQAIKSSDYTGISLMTKICNTGNYGDYETSYSVRVNRNTTNGYYSQNTSEVSRKDFQQAWQQAKSYLVNACPVKYPKPSECSKPDPQAGPIPWCY